MARSPFRPASLLTTLLLLSGTAFGAVNGWSSLGPDGGAVNDVVADPVNPSIVYAATATGGVFKSVDHGETWASANRGLSSSVHMPFDLNVRALALDPVHPSTLYASLEGLGLFRSANGGATWAPGSLNILSGADPGIVAIAVDPHDPRTVYAGGYVSRDGGDTWTRGLLTLFEQQALAVDPSRAGVAYLGTHEGVFRTDDSGGSWTLTGSGPVDVQSIALDPRAGVLYAGTASGAVFSSPDGGATWSVAGVPAGSNPVSALALPPGSSGVVFAATRAGAFRSQDAGRTWTAVWPSSVSGIAFDFSSPARFFLATGDGIAQSDVTGVSPRPSNAGLRAVQVRAIAVDARAPDSIWAGADPARVYRSTDRGGTWTAVSIPNAADAESFVALGVDASGPSVLYAALMNGIFRSEDAGMTWVPAVSLFTAPGGPSVRAFAADPARPGRIYATTEFQIFGGGLFVSSDGGRSWQSTSLGQAIQALATDPAHPGVVFALGIGGLFKSVDFGDTFTNLGGGPPVFPAASIAVDATDPATLYSVGGIPGTLNTLDFFRSTDGGVTWSPSDVGNALLSGPIAVDRLGSALFAAASGTVLRSQDRGLTWKALSRGLDTRAVLAIAVSGTDASTEYAALQGEGVFGYTATGAPSQCTADTTTLCLQNSRFEVRVAFRTPTGLAGDGQAISVAADTGAFWFFSGGNEELLVKVLDGRPVDGNFWVFFGALTDVAFTMTVRDVATGAVRTYENPAGRVASVADTSAFPGVDGGALGPLPAGLVPSQEGASSCGGGPGALCVNEGRFRVEVSWSAAAVGSGIGVPVPLTADTGAFWFFSENNLELMVKVVDGRAVNGRFWVFAGGLSDVAYQIRVTDSLSGAVKTYTNAAGSLSSVADTDSF